jgi:hypothetical protein
MYRLKHRKREHKDEKQNKRERKDEELARSGTENQTVVPCILLCFYCVSSNDIVTCADIVASGCRTINGPEY